MLFRRLLNLMTLNWNLLADELVEVADRAEVDLRSREERLDPDVDERPPFTRATMTPSTVASSSAALAMSSQTASGRPSPSRGWPGPCRLLGLDEDVDLVAYLDHPFPVTPGNSDLHHAFGLEADVDDDVSAGPATMVPWTISPSRTLFCSSMVASKRAAKESAA
jgi:hypothetical protein